MVGVGCEDLGDQRKPKKDAEGQGMPWLVPVSERIPGRSRQEPGLGFKGV